VVHIVRINRQGLTGHNLTVFVIDRVTVNRQVAPRQQFRRVTLMTTYYNRHPSLHLKGDWLKEAGFGTDTPVTVAVEQGQLVIRPVVE
ncbi:SymE family type I addiction module toxin, partial [Buttiauxella ferragutiae]